MSPVPSDLPPGVSGTEPQITGGWPTVHIPLSEVEPTGDADHAACNWELAETGDPDEVSCVDCLTYHGYVIPGIDPEVQEQLGFYLAEVPDATPAQIREAVQEFLDRDPRET